MLFWLILGGLIILLGLGIVLMQKWRWGLEFWGIAIAMTAGVFLGSALLVWPACYFSEVSNIIEFKSTAKTIENSRTEELDPIERAALQQKVIECNVWLAQAQYWNQYFDPIYPDEVMELEPIR